MINPNRLTLDSQQGDFAEEGFVVETTLPYHWIHVGNMRWLPTEEGIRGSIPMPGIRVVRHDGMATPWYPQPHGELEDTQAFLFLKAELDQVVFSEHALD